MTTMITTPVFPPADATEVGAWEFVGGGPAAKRYFRGTKRGDKVRVDIAGLQYSDGTARRWIFVDVPRKIAELDADEANEVAADLLAAAGEVAADLLAAAGELDTLDLNG